MQRAIEHWKNVRNVYEPVDGKITIPRTKSSFIEMYMSEGDMLTVRQKTPWQPTIQVVHLTTSDLFAVMEHFISVKALEEVIQVKKEEDNL